MKSLINSFIASITDPKTPCVQVIEYQSGLIEKVMRTTDRIKHTADRILSTSDQVKLTTARIKLMIGYQVELIE